MIPYEQKPYVIPIFIPHSGCPHTCVFCNQKTITGEDRPIPSPERFQAIIHAFLGYTEKRRFPVQIAFYGGNFLGIKSDRIHYLLEQAAAFVQSGKVNSIRFSTRPDTITMDRLDLLKGFPVETIELGVQSMDDAVLSRAKRGHSAVDTEIAVERIQKRGLEIGLQVMVGLPGEDVSSCILTGDRIADLSPDFVRIYPTLVLKNSLLAEWYSNGRYIPLSLRKAVFRSKRLFQKFQKKDIPVIRMGLQPTEDLQMGSEILAGPYHPSFGELVYSEVFFDKAAVLIDRLLKEGTIANTVALKVHPQSISKMKGHKNQNVHKLKKRFGLQSVRIISDRSVSKNCVIQA